MRNSSFFKVLFMDFSVKYAQDNEKGSYIIIYPVGN